MKYRYDAATRSAISDDGMARLEPMGGDVECRYFVFHCMGRKYKADVQRRERIIPGVGVAYRWVLVGLGGTELVYDRLRTDGAWDNEIKYQGLSPIKSREESELVGNLILDAFNAIPPTSEELLRSGRVFADPPERGKRESIF